MSVSGGGAQDRRSLKATPWYTFNCASEAKRSSFEVEAPHDDGSKCCSWAHTDHSASTVLCLIYKGTASSTPSALFYSPALLSSVPAPGSGHTQVSKGQRGGGRGWRWFFFQCFGYFQTAAVPACSPPRDFVCIILLKTNAKSFSLRIARLLL